MLILPLTIDVGQAQEPQPDDIDSTSSSEPAYAMGVQEETALVGNVFSGGADYDSGWVTIATDETKTLTHNLGGSVDNYVVNMEYKTSTATGINHLFFGGNDFGRTPLGGSDENDRVGAYWRSLSSISITVYRRPEDIYAEQVRIRIWVDASPDWDSGWLSLTAGATATLITHNLGGDADDYVVDMQYKDTGSGVNQRYYGGNDFGSKSFFGTREDDRVGSYWRSLTNTTITLYRRPDDDYAPQVRIRIWVRPTPTYDSGWISIPTNTGIQLNHNIGGDPDDYLVDMQFKSSGNGINQRYYGGVDLGANPPVGMSENDRVGAYWRTLTDTSITVYRRSEDIYAEQVRIRIWNSWTPSHPEFDSGWISLSAGGPSTTINHHLGGDAGDYLVDMLFNNASSGIHQRYYGGMDFGLNPPSGINENDRVGAYWTDLTDSSIKVFRRTEDSFVQQMRIRIWKMPKPDYDSGWISISMNSGITLTHNLGNNINDYLVDLQYQSTDIGINQRYFGGTDFGAKHPLGMSEDDRVGAFWHKLTATSILVFRRPEDIYTEQVRIRIWRVAKPDYDSGWHLASVNTSTTLSHNIGSDTDSYFVNMSNYTLSSGNINQRCYGGNDFGANHPLGKNEDDRVGTYWHNLTDTDITFFRRAEDNYADYVHIRIWRTPTEIYLPFVVRN